LVRVVFFSAAKNINFVETCDITGDPSIGTDIFAIGFEEIVDLTAKNITNARWVKGGTVSRHLKEIT